jgi:aminomethyltransferase
MNRTPATFCRICDKRLYRLVHGEARLMGGIRSSFPGPPASPASLPALTCAPKLLPWPGCFMLRRTPLFAIHQQLGARLVEFGGWEMPVHYTSITDEHLAVRRAAGIFDISHMGELLVTGPLALDFLNDTLTNDLRKITPGHGQYTLMCHDRGGVIDDLYAYWLAENQFLLVVNASRIDADFAWLEAELRKFSGAQKVKLDNASDRYGAVAVQGPTVVEFIDSCFAIPNQQRAAGTHLRDLKKNQVASCLFQARPAWVARTGYTGEDGFEIIAPAELIDAIWKKVMAAGAGHGLKPAGLGARDTLRTEMCYPLYGHELDQNTTPIEAGLGFFVALNKLGFVGRNVLAAQKANGVTKKCVAFKMTGRSAPPRPQYPIWGGGSPGSRIGEVTSGTQSPSLGVGVGLGYVAPQFAASGTPIEIEIRNNRAPAVIVSKPIYRKPAPPQG